MRLKIMNNKSLQSRRDFFRNTSKKLLPILGIIALSILPQKAKSAPQFGCGWSCLYSCAGQCINSCYMSCMSQCAMMCGNSCRGGCNDLCATNCQGGCNTQCHSTCLTSCNNTCFSMAALEALSD